MRILARERVRSSRLAWWTLMLLGCCAVAFGILTIVWPHLTFLVFLYIFGAYAVIEGLIMISSAFYLWKAPELGDYSRPELQPGEWMLVLCEGVLSVLAGLFCLFAPTLSAQLSIYVVATWALFAGLAALLHAPSRGWLLGISGALAIAISLLLFFEPLNIMRSIFWLLGVLALIAGLLLIVQGWLERSVQKKPEKADIPAL
jgi:uncharacterized membrane protein HdeD (DUF308 family)